MNGSEYKPVSVGNWILTFILLAIPLLNIVMLIAWAVGATTHPSKKTFAQAYFVLLIIAVFIGAFAAVIFGLLGHHPHPVTPVRTGA